MAASIFVSEGHFRVVERRGKFHHILMPGKHRLLPFVETASDDIALKQAINSFLAKLPPRTRVIFMRRYWYMSSIKEIAEDYGTPEGTVKSILSRTRQDFKNHLLKEGIAL